MSTDKSLSPAAIKWEHIDTQIKREGREIVLPNIPADMPYDDAIAAIQRKQKDEEQEFRVIEFLDAYPEDAAVAFMKAMARLYGWSSPVPTPGFFGPKPPVMKTVKIGPRIEDETQVVWGAFKVPGVEAPIQISPYFNGDVKPPRPQLVIQGTVRKKNRAQIMELVQVAREILATESIYRGKPIMLNTAPNGSLDMDQAPTFMDVSRVSEDDLILNRDTRESVEVSLLTPIKRTAECRKHKIPLKRGILLAGPYGTGKTLTARVAAKVAQDHGWTFVMLDRVEGLRVALEFANRYAPCVIFAEDIDRITDERDDAANDLVNEIDGIVSKDKEVITVLTTNHPEKIEPVMLRPGRLDAVIGIEPPDAEAVERLIRMYAGTLLAPREDLTEVGKALMGQIPATIREVAERAKLGMVARGGSKIVQSDLLVMARSMLPHLTLLNKARPEPSVGDQLVTVLKKIVWGGDGEMDEEGLGNLGEQIENVGANTENQIDRAKRQIVATVAEMDGTVAGLADRIETAQEELKNAELSATKLIRSDIAKLKAS